MPLYCIKNYENLDENLDNLEFVNNINLPNKCQNKFFQKESSTSNGEHSWTDKFNDLIDISSNMIDFERNGKTPNLSVRGCFIHIVIIY